MSYFTRSRVSTEVRKMERQLALAETPEQNALRLPEVVSNVLKFFAWDNDIQTLKRARVVSQIWKKCVFDVVKKNPNLVLRVTSEEINESESDSNSGNLLLPKSMNSCFENLTKSSNIPMQFVTNSWSPEVESFLKQFEQSIVSFHIYGNGLKGFPLCTSVVPLPKLKDCLFAAIDVTSNSEKSQQCSSALKVWKQFAKSKNCDRKRVWLKVSQITPVNSNDFIFDDFPWNCLEILTCSSELLNEIYHNDLRSLKKLDICDSNNHRVTTTVENGFLLNAAQNLTELHINSSGEYHIGTMTSLQVLKLKGGQVFPMNSSAMPNVSSIVAHEDFVRGQISRPLLTRQKNSINTVSNLQLEESWGPLNDMNQVAFDLVTCFPNLKSLSWKTNLSREVNCLKAAPAIFSSLGNLTTLKFSVDIGIEHDVFRYISGIHPRSIPIHEESWETCLTGNNISICNLPNLRKFELSIRNELFPLRFASKETRFLFIAAFAPMEHLKELNFHYVILGDTSVTSAWAAEIGRSIRMVHYCRSTGTNIEYQT